MDEWLKLIGTPELSRIVADITGDGHLQIKDWRGLVSFYSNDITQIEKLKEKFYHFFGIKGHIYIDNRIHKRYKLFFISKSLANFFENIGVPKGNKTNLAYGIPSWIFEGNSQVKAGYLMGFFTAEGYIYSTKSKDKAIRWRIGIEQYKNEMIKDSCKSYMEQLKAMLRDFEICSSPVRFCGQNIRKDGSKSVGARFDIEKSSFRNFYKYIGFDHAEKQRKLILSMRET